MAQAWRRYDADAGATMSATVTVAILVGVFAARGAVGRPSVPPPVSPNAEQFRAAIDTAILSGAPATVTAENQTWVAHAHTPLPSEWSAQCDHGAMPVFVTIC